MAVFEVRGVRVRTASKRRYAVFAIRLSHRTSTCIRRSDSVEVVRKFARSHGYGGDWVVVIVDTVTGQEVAK